MKPSQRPTVLLAATVALALAVLASMPAAATVYSVHLTNGKVFDTRYQPQEASWDANQVLILTEYGNLIGLAKDDIEKVTTDTEVRGFGKVLNSTTISLGQAPNDAAAPAETGQQTSTAQLMDYLQNLQQNQPVYNQDQFVNPGDLGRGSNPGGLPLSYALGSNSPPAQLGFPMPVPAGLGAAPAAPAAPAAGTTPPQ